jgi:hypothetical protein
VFLIPQLLFGGSLIPLVGKGFLIKFLSALMVARWAFAGLGAAIHLGTPNNQTNPFVQHYGGLFSHSAVLMGLLLVVFAAVFLGMVAYRLQTRYE